MVEISNLDRLYAMLELVQEKLAIMSEWVEYFTPKQHIEMWKLEKKIKKEIRRELNKNNYGK